MPNSDSSWSSQIIGILSSEGVTKVPVGPKWRLYLAKISKLLGWTLLAPLVIFAIAALLAGSVIFSFMTFRDGQPYMNLVVSSAMLLGMFVIIPRTRRAMRELSQIKIGIDPIGTIRKAKHPPVLFLRSFDFDKISGAMPLWKELLPINVAMPTAEMTLIQMIWRYAPVLAIGRPGDSIPPPGAVRFYVKDTIWKKTVEAIVPYCPLVIWTTGHTEGLRWEIEHLIERVKPSKVILWLHHNVGTRTREERAAEWNKFYGNYSHIFPKSMPEDAADARFIAFADDWSPILIPARAYRPGLRELLISWPSTYGLDAILRQRLR
jgi:hypothetical protein